MTEDEQYMLRAIQLAMRGRGRVEPNPMVGCVIVKDGRIIGEGYHQEFGGPHAEPNALAACTESPVSATAYVTLEPCCHLNKKTPPCVPRLIEARIGRVVLGAIDPNPEVSGKGIARLREAGIEVATGVLETQCSQLIAPYVAITVHQRPYVTLKWAQSTDAKVAALPGAPRLMISNQASNLAVHRLRAASDAILVGINTVISDDPLLTVRGVDAGRTPLRIALDSDLRIPLESRLVQTARDKPSLLFCATYEHRSAKADALRAAGMHVEELDQWPDPREKGRLSLGEMLLCLWGWIPQTITHLLVEPGPTLAANFFERKLVDRVWVIQSQSIAGKEARKAAPIPLGYLPTGRLPLDGDILTEYLNTRSPVYFHPSSSADFFRELPHKNFPLE
jgi:diaminohydroxyphosphoribosylaminopyrimidine deaminase/5-amino-6-(5-phosphoribosylamino)uracil reductase